MRRRLIVATITIVAVVALAWMFLRPAPTVSARASVGEIAYTWRGKFVGQAVVPATLNWCPGSRQGLLQGISADTGIVIVLHEASALTVGQRAIVSPEAQPGLPRPRATAAVRWMRDSATIVGFRSTGGTVDMKSVGETATGTFDVRLQVPGGTDTLVVRGTFDRVPVTATAVGCS